MQKDFKKYTREEERDLFKKYHDGDVEAYHTLIESQMAWGARLAKQYYTTWGRTDLELLYCAANLGIIEAVNTFDLEKKTRLTTHASFHIYKQLYAERASTKGPVYVPRYKHGKKHREDSAYQNAIRATGHADFLEQSGDSLNDYIEREHTDYILIHVHETMETVLSDKQRYVLKERFITGRTLKDIGLELNVTRERIRQIEVLALKKVKAEYVSREQRRCAGLSA